MRLLESTTLTFKEWADELLIPSYAILSHTWADDEVSYQDMQQNRARAESKTGFQKLVYVSIQAQKDGLGYFWIDTCCIDKSSSAELSEAVNSMFRWYESAHTCYTFLSDVEARQKPDDHEPDQAWVTTFSNSRWFTRGWTLQELIAPRNLIFYSSQWSRVGTKQDLAPYIAQSTGIPINTLVHGHLSGVSVAQKMSWVSGRSTTRREDLAYCLIGIFEVNMPMLYGEGGRAFVRLQEEIIKTTDDMSIFSWVDPQGSFGSYRGLLASSPSFFARCKHVSWTRNERTAEFSVTNKGIKLVLQLSPRTVQPNEFVAVLYGVANTTMPNGVIGLYVHKIGDNQYARVQPDQLALLPVMPPVTSTSLFVRQKIVMESPEHSRAAAIVVKMPSDFMGIVDVKPASRWNPSDQRFSLAPGQVSAIGSFSFCSFANDKNIINVIIDTSRVWGSILEIGHDWERIQHINPFTHRIQCRKRGQTTIEITIERGLVGDESLIYLSLVLLQREGFSRRADFFKETLTNRGSTW
ncbi:hypothetical protein FHL15_010717 [Xylaria flabelliformis]|uniref:Heterokaryon incompatibility domain-containing protein n=1 Tax=Xylaria flabelliformis TaxID=2512241 RepID=A0A553HKC6_9PEZI|nr:hypothetical protein FHL15_010717 [Xylaria flabelliformis]